MRKGICRALLVLALLVPLSRSSFGDSFAVRGSFSDSGDVEFVSMSIPNLTFNGHLGVWGGGNQVTWGPFNNLWPLGYIGGEEVAVGIPENFSDWSFDGYTGSRSSGIVEGSLGGCIVEEGGCVGVNTATWTGQIDLYADDGTAIEILMSGGGTGSFGGTYFSGIGFDLISGTINATGVGRVFINGVEQPCVPEPSTLTLMGIAGVASIFAMQFRRARATQN